MKARKTEKPFQFSAKSLPQLENLFTSKAPAKRFITDLQSIVGKHIASEANRSEFPAAVSIRSNARSIEKASIELLRSLEGLSEAEQGLIGQSMWVVDKVNFFPGSVSTDRLVQEVTTLKRASSLLQRKGNAGRPGLQLEHLIGAVHNAYVRHFQAVPVLDNDPQNKFIRCVKICIREANIQLPPKLLTHIRIALGQ